MPTTSQRTPASVVNDASIGTQSWTGASDAATSNDVKATVNVGPAVPESNYLWATDYGFASEVPSDAASIDGVEFLPERSASATSAIRDLSIRLIIAGVLAGDNKASVSTWPTTDTTATYGSAADKWNTTVTVAQVRSTNFGVAIAVTHAGGSAPQARVDAMPMRITYTDSGGVTRQTQARIGVVRDRSPISRFQ